MKKILAFFAAAALGFSAMATPFSMPSPIPEFNYKGRVNLELLNSFGWGFHIVAPGADAAFADHTSVGRSREIFFNLLQLEYSPNAVSKITLGADLNWDTYRLSDGWFWLPEKNEGRVEPALAGDYGYALVKKATLRTFGFDIPLDYTHSFGPMLNLDVTVGVAAELNFAGRTKFKGINEAGNLEKHTHNGDLYRATNIRTNALTMNAHIIVTYEGLGIYFKYCPFPQFQAGYGPQFTTWSLGLIIR